MPVIRESTFRFTRNLSLMQLDHIVGRLLRPVFESQPLVYVAESAIITDAVVRLYDERFLVRRPLLQAIAHDEGPPPVLLIDEVDRADDEFEAFLLEILSDYSVTVPEIGTFRAAQAPVVVVTSNRTRE